MGKSETVKANNSNFLMKLVKNQCFIPLAALLLLAVINLVADPGFFKITLGYNAKRQSGFVRFPDHHPGQWI